MNKEFRLFVALLAIGLIFLTHTTLHAVLLAAAALIILRPRLVWWQW